MPDYTVIPATFELRHYPDAYTETELRDGASWELSPGTYKIVAVVNGAELVVQSFKGGGVQKKLAAAKRARESGRPEQQQQPEQLSAAQPEQLSAAQSEQQQSPPGTTTSTA